jgi:hypothetical protein
MLDWGTQTGTERRKQMANLKRKLIALFFAVVILGASIAVSSCKKEAAPVKKATSSKQKIPSDLQ